MASVDWIWSWISEENPKIGKTWLIGNKNLKGFLHHAKKRLFVLAHYGIPVFQQHFLVLKQGQVRLQHLSYKGRKVIFGIPTQLFLGFAGIAQ